MKGHTQNALWATLNIGQQKQWRHYQESKKKKKKKKQLVALLQPSKNPRNLNKATFDTSFMNVEG